jgi:hypothetical protein
MKLKIGLDIHGVIEASPSLFSKISQLVVRDGGEVHILTGIPLSKTVLNDLKKYKIKYTHLFSILDYHQELGTPIKWDKNGNGSIDPYLWDKTKSDYCRKHKIDLHFDDSNVYGYFFTTPFTRFFSKNTQREKKIKR